MPARGVVRGRGPALYWEPTTGRTEDSGRTQLGNGGGPPLDRSDAGKGREAARGLGPEGPAHAVAWSGGKDSTLALHRARTAGLRVTTLASVVDGDTGRIPYHGTRADVLRAQASALGLDLALARTAEGRGFEEAFTGLLEELSAGGIEGMVFGNVHLADVRAWWEKRVSAAGLEHVEPLWGGDPARLVREYVGLGYRSRVVSVLLDSPADPGWLGRELDRELLEEIAARGGVDPCGERGEFHTVCRDGPLFLRPVDLRAGETSEVEGHRILDLAPAGG